MSAPQENSCISCAAPLQGKYCHSCGEKVVDASDFSLFALLGRAFSSITNLDAKFYKTVRSLLFKPGELSLAFIEGRRKAFMSPFQIFLLSSVFFFFFIANTDIFYAPAKWFFLGGNNTTAELKVVAEETAAERNLSLEEFSVLYDQTVIANSKLTILLIAPFFALFLYAFGRRQMPELGKHVVVAVHIFAFLLIIFVLHSKFMRWLPYNFNRWWFIIPIQSVFWVYTAATLKTAWQRGWVNAFLLSTVLTFIFGFLIGLHRYFISFYTLHSL